MSSFADRVRSIVEEMKRREVFRVAVAYFVTAWLILQVATTALPVLNLPAWTFTVLVVVLIVGFPIALMLAWAFDLTPEGVRRASPRDAPLLPEEPRAGVAPPPREQTTEQPVAPRTRNSSVHGQSKASPVRRRLWMTALLYAGIGWLVLRIVDQVFPIFQVPESVRSTVILVTVLGFPVALVIAYVSALGFDQVIYEKEERIQRIQARAAEGRPFALFLEDQLEIAMIRDDISSDRARRRADNLFSIGRALMVMSVLAPVASAAVYALTDPLPDEVISDLVQLQGSLGTLPQQVQLSVHRDWKVLFAGVSVGFLFLAAARGILNQQAKESETHFSLGERIAEYERLTSVLKIRMHQSSDGNVPSDVETQIIQKLLTQRPAALKLDPPKTDPPEPSQPYAIQVEQLITQLKGLKELR